MFNKLNVLRFALIIACSVTSSLDAAVLVKAKMWPKNSVLNVVFIDGTSQQKDQVSQIAPLWLEKTSLKFQFFDGFANAPEQTHIRISFLTETGSALGNHGDLKSRDATLLLAELNQEISGQRAQRLILHEFGHALGFEHEYRNPKWPFDQSAIQQQIERCFPRMQALQLTPVDARARCIEINQSLSANHTISTVYDEFSIMNYPLTVKLSNHSSKRIKAKHQLSILDLMAVQRWYGD